MIESRSRRFGLTYGACVESPNPERAARQAAAMKEALEKIEREESARTKPDKTTTAKKKEEGAARVVPASEDGGHSAVLGWAGLDRSRGSGASGPR